MCISSTSSNEPIGSYGTNSPFLQFIYRAKHGDFHKAMFTRGSVFPWIQATIEKTLKEHAHSTEIFENIEHSSSDIDAGSPVGRG